MFFKKNLSLEIKTLLYENYFEKVYKLALYLTQDKYMAEEITQEVFTIAFEKYYQLKDPSKVSTWLKTITINTTRALYNQRKKVVTLESEIFVHNYDKNSLINIEDFILQKELKEDIKKSNK